MKFIYEALRPSEKPHGSPMPQNCRSSVNIPAALPAALPALFHESDKVTMMGEPPARYQTDFFDETDSFKNVGTIAPTNTRASVPPVYSAFDTTSTLVEDNDRDIEMGQLPPYPEETHDSERAPWTDRDAINAARRNTSIYSRFESLLRSFWANSKSRFVREDPERPKLLYWPKVIVGCSVLLRLIISVSYGSLWFSLDCGMTKGFYDTSSTLGLMCLWELTVLCIYHIASDRRALFTTILLAHSAFLWMAAVAIFWESGLESFGQCGYLVSWIFPASLKHSL